MILAVLILHLALGLVVLATGDRWGRHAFAVAAIAPVATIAWLAGRWNGIVDGRPIEQRLSWIDQLDLAIELRVDALGAVMVVLVSGIGALVCGYALGYFSHPGPGTARLAGLMTLFAGAMLGVVVSDHVLTLFLFWELTSVTSYLLIGNDDDEPRARDAALSAIIITGAGGLALLAGLVLLGQQAGTYRLSELAAAAPAGTAVEVALVLVLIGAFTKSAQLPFGGWLPGAMVAPTPISTYLHAATMVKAGVYLVARLAPAVADVGVWRPLILVVSSATMIAGGWRALRQHDLKLLLAYGTVSQLGFLMLLLGMGADALAQAGVVLLLAHGAFKAALFMVVGIVDHQVGTRDVRRLHGFGRGWRTVQAIAIVGAASMAGIPPVIGFIAKEKGLDAAIDGGFGGSGALVVVIVIGSILTFAYSGRFVLGVFGRLGHADHERTTPTAEPPSGAFVAPAALLTAFTVVAGLAPIVVDELVKAATVAAYAMAEPKDVVLWAGVNAALALSIVVIATGSVLVVAHARVERGQETFHRGIRWLPDADHVFWGAVSGTLRVARRCTRIVQNGSLPVYLMVILGVAAIGPLVPAVRAVEMPDEVVGRWVHVPIAVVIVLAAVSATIVRRRIAAALLLGAVGLAMAGLYSVQAAPDLALTQFAIETLATVLFVLVLRFLPQRFDDPRTAVTAPVRLVVAGAVGVGAFVLALVAAAARDDVTAPPVSDEMLARSVPDGKGSNVVNVILVDFRGLDTLGEIAVLAVAGLGMVALARVARRPGDGARAEPSFARLAVVDTSSRLLYTSILVLSLYFLFAGHNQPGGGFVGGLTAGAAISLRYVAGGASAVRGALRFRPWSVLGAGLAIASATAIVPLLTGNDVLEHADLERKLPVLGTLKTTSALPFDIGVYLVVVGLVLLAYEAFGDDIDLDEDGTPIVAGATGGHDPAAGDALATGEPLPADDTVVGEVVDVSGGSS